MRVKAKVKGFYKRLRNVGEIFTLDEKMDAPGKTISSKEQFSDRWMEIMKGDKKPAENLHLSKEGEPIGPDVGVKDKAPDKPAKK